MAQEITTARTLWLTENGSYAGTAAGDERVRLTKSGMTVSLWDIDTVVGSSGDDMVAFGGAPNQPHSKMNLRSGDDTLRLRGGEDYVMKLRGVETITAEPDSSLTIVGRAKFKTDGSFSIATHSTSKGALSLQFTDIADDITLSLNAGVISFGSGFDFTRDGEGRLVVSRNGHELTFVGIDEASKAITIVADGVTRTCAEMLSKIPTGLEPTVTEFSNDHPDGVWSDDDRVVNYVTRFSEPVAGVSADDLSIYGGVLTSGPSVAADGLTVTFAIEVPLDSDSFLYVSLNDTIKNLGGQSFTPVAYDDGVRVNLVPPVFYGMSSSVDSWRATNADSIEFRGQSANWLR